MENLRKIIGCTPLFEGLPAAELAQIEHIAVERSYARGETVFLEGDEGLGFYIVAAGTVKVFKSAHSGKEHILHIFGPGSPIGEVPVFSGKPFPASAVALENSVLLFLPRQSFVTLVTENPGLALNQLAVLCLRMRQFTQQIENIALKEVPARLASYLLYLAEEQQNDHAVELPISKGQLSSLLGTIPETLSRILAKMSAEGLIEVEGRRIRLCHPPGLRELAGISCLKD